MGILSKVVYRVLAHPLKTIGLNGLSGLFGLFFAIDETDASNYLWDQLEALKSAPMLLGFQTEFKDHGQCRDS